MRHSKARRTVTITVWLVLAVALWVFVAPTQLGGSKAYVITHGSSMEPKIHQGDLVILRQEDQYRVGEIVAYHSILLNKTVLHRIIGRSGDKYVMKGDNNSWVDSDQPTQSDLIGRKSAQIDGAGKWLEWTATPTHAALIVGVVLVLGGLGRRKKSGGRQRRRPAVDGREGNGGQIKAIPITTEHKELEETRHMEQLRIGSIKLPAAVTHNAGWLTGTLAGVAALFALLAVVAFLQPLDRAGSAEVPYNQDASFSYSAPGVAGVYDGANITTGDPIFLKLTHSLTAGYDYAFSTSAPHDVEGTADLSLVVSDSSGWHRSIPLAGKTEFTSDQIKVTGAVDLRAVRSIIDRFERLTGVIRPSYNLSLVGEVAVRGSVAGRDFEDTLRPHLDFQIDPLQLQMGDIASGGSQEDAQKSLELGSGGSVMSSTSAAEQMPIIGLGVGAARTLGILGALVCLAGAALLWLPYATSRRRDEPAQIRARYGSELITVDASALSDREGIVDVTGMASLARVAELADRMILHSQRDEVHSYFVDDGGVIYRYQTRGSVAETKAG